MTVTIIAELPESPLRLDLDAGTASITRTVIIDGADLEEYLDDLFGMSFQEGWGFAHSHHALHPTYTWLKATGVEAESHPSKDPPHPTDTRYPNLLRVRVTYKAAFLSAAGWPLNDPSVPNGPL